MPEKKGHFESGRWVEDPEPAVQSVPAAVPETVPIPNATPNVEQLAGEASQSVQKAVDDVLRFGRHLFGTPEGREHIEKKVRKAGADLEQAIQTAVEAARRKVEK